MSKAFVKDASRCWWITRQPLEDRIKGLLLHPSLIDNIEAQFVIKKNTIKYKLPAPLFHSLDDKTLPDLLSVETEKKTRFIRGFCLLSMARGVIAGGILPGAISMQSLEFYYVGGESSLMMIICIIITIIIQFVTILNAFLKEPFVLPSGL